MTDEAPFEGPTRSARSTVIGTISLVWAASWLFAALSYRPLAPLVRALPGDARDLFEPGGELLLDFARLRHDELAAALLDVFTLFLCAPLFLLPARALLVVVARGVHSVGEAFERSASLSFRLLPHLLLFLVSFALVGLADVLSLASTAPLFFDEAGALRPVWCSVFVAVNAALVLPLLLAHDDSLVRLARGESFGSALRLGFRSACRPLFLLARLAKGSASLAVIGLGLAAAKLTADAHWLVETAAGQGVVWFGVFVDYAWFRIIASRQRLDDRSARGVEPGDPTPDPDA